MAPPNFSREEKKILFFSFYILAFGLAAMDFFNPALPAIQHDFQTNQDQVKNLIVVYMLFLGVAQFFYGSISDTHGRKLALTVGLGIETVGMIAAAVAPNLTWFYISRILTAIGAATCTVISRALIVDSITGPSKVGKAFSYFSAAGQLSPALAPLIGSSIGTAFGWRIQFACFAVAVVASALTFMFALPETHPLHTDLQATTAYAPI